MPNAHLALIHQPGKNWFLPFQLFNLPAEKEPDLRELAEQSV